DRRMEVETVRLAFQYARARAASNDADTAPTTSVGPVSNTQIPGAAPMTRLSSRKAGQQKAIQELQSLQTQANDLKAKIAQAGRREAPVLAHKLDIREVQIELAQPRLESYTAIVEFENTATAGASEVTGLSARIDELERSLPELAESARPDATMQVLA